MKTIVKASASLLGTLLLLGSCTNQPDLTNRVFTYLDEDQHILALQLFENGRAACSTFWHAPNEEETTYIWDGRNIDTLSFRIANDELTLYKKDKVYAKSHIEDNRSLKLRLYKEQGEISSFMIYHDQRFASTAGNNKYVGKAYECSTISDQGMELLFVTADRVIARPAEGYVKRANDYQLGKYELTEDGCLIVKLKDSHFELTPEKENLTFEAMGYNYTFRKNKTQSTLWDGLEAVLIHQEAKREYENGW